MNAKLTLLLACLLPLGSTLSVLPTQMARDVRVSLSQPLTVRWRYASNATLNLTPASDKERVYLPLGGGMIISLHASDGQLYWKSEIGGEFSAAPIADDRAVYVASETTTADGDNRKVTGSIRALGREAGVTSWLRELPKALQGALAISKDKILAGAGDGAVYAFDKATGNIVWSFRHKAAFNCQPVISSKGVYVGSEDGTLFALDESSGKVRWHYSTRGPVRGPVAAVGDNVYFGSGDGYVYALSEDDGRLRWRTRTGAAVQVVANVTGGLLVASLDNFAYLLSLNRGKRIWKRQLPGRIASPPLTADGNALFTPLSSEAGVVLALRDGKQVNSLPTGGESNTAASPIIVADAVFLTTEHGLLAFSQPRQAKSNVKP
jgi:eukaryotic-like serine/threonine-protein kinase